MKFAFRPLKFWHINQYFGENKACVDIATGRTTITCDGLNPPEGYRSLYGDKGHEALDLQALTWTPFYFCYEGVIDEKVVDEKRGLGVGVRHEPWPGVFYRSRYWHLIAIDVDIGQKVSMGDFGGYCDNTGYSSGSHMHFEIGTCNADSSNYVPIDPQTVIYPTFALDAKTTIGKIKEQIAIILDKLSDLVRNR